MLNSPIFAFFVQGIPETTVLIYAGLALHNVKSKFVAILKSALVITFIAYIVKQLPLDFYIYPPILIFIIAVVINLSIKISPLRSLVISFSAVALQAITEIVLFWYWQDVYKFDYSTIITVPIYRIAFGLQVPVVMCIFVFIITAVRSAITKHKLPI